MQEIKYLFELFVCPENPNQENTGILTWEETGLSTVCLPREPEPGEYQNTNPKRNRNLYCLSTRRTRTRRILENNRTPGTSFLRSIKIHVYLKGKKSILTLFLQLANNCILKKINKKFTFIHVERTVNYISIDSPCKDGNARFTRISLNASSYQALIRHTCSLFI